MVWGFGAGVWRQEVPVEREKVGVQVFRAVSRRQMRVHGVCAGLTAFLKVVGQSPTRRAALLIGRCTNLSRTPLLTQTGLGPAASTSSQVFLRGKITCCVGWLPAGMLAGACCIGISSEIISKP